MSSVGVMGEVRCPFCGADWFSICVERRSKYLDVVEARRVCAKDRRLAWRHVAMHVRGKHPKEHAILVELAEALRRSAEKRRGVVTLYIPKSPGWVRGGFIICPLCGERIRGLVEHLLARHVRSRQDLERLAKMLDRG